MTSGVYISNYPVLAKYVLLAETGSITANYPVTLNNGYYGAATTAPAVVVSTGTPSGRNDNVTPGAGSFFNAAITQLTQLKAAINGLTTTVPNYTGSTQTVTTLGPGVYDCPTSMAFSGSILNLDAGGDSTAQFIFRVDSTLSFSSVSSVNLINGAAQTNVFWVAARITLNGSIASIPGVFIAAETIVFSNLTQINGRLFAGDSITIPTGTTLNVDPPNPKIVYSDYPTLQQYALISGGNLLGTNITIQNGYYAVSQILQASITSNGPFSGRRDTTNGYSSLYNQAIQDLDRLKSDLTALTSKTNTYSQTNQQNVTVTPGVYANTNATIIFSGSSPVTITLDAQGDPNAQFIFRTNNTGITFSNVTSINLAGGALAENIFWFADTISLNSGSNVIQGTLISKTGVIEFTETSTANGRMFSGSTMSFSGSINLPTDIPCYLKGTQILTDTGYVPIELIQEGDKIVTFADIDSENVVTLREPSLQSCVSLRVHTISNPSVKNRPIFFKAGSLGDNLPDRDLYVSRNHGVYFTNHLREARFLANGETILPDLECRKLEYYHIELESHVCIKANGVLAESLNMS